MRLLKISLNVLSAGLVLVAGYLFFTRFAGDAHALTLDSGNDAPAARDVETAAPADAALPPFSGAGDPDGIPRLAMVQTTTPTRPRVDVAPTRCSRAITCSRSPNNTG